MASTAELVEGHLESDLVLERSLSRGVLSFRRAARWLIDHNEWEATEEAVVSALRRYDPPASRTSIDEGYDQLRDAQTGLSTGWTLLEIPGRAPRRSEALDAIGAHLGSQPVCVLSGAKHTSLLVRGSIADRIFETYEDSIRDIHQPVAQLRVTFERKDPAVSMAVSILTDTFCYRGIELLGIYSSGLEYAFLVPQQILEPAHDVLLHLRDGESLQE